jgi:hypothetical protein
MGHPELSEPASVHIDRRHSQQTYGSIIEPFLESIVRG